ncbi:anaerobic ribonucleoside-triphosphate reductase activating protein [Sulfurimonas sp.]|uniref:anaerobic ribonucleoside-triphosphate reductase activating protein n=1 Tax=Sulfurimonas sp. TaxID=2022749 RepID=UPI00260F70FB|nr:anaerobic ribonucleoside-triphosphate reductase activating protein [Sulfurimonas sp.]MCW8894387.1 anaerobic ribonucleoside-triphosphate reductase activating protein [Sulfurimonas sp.]MCW9068305.1 anaerobic ribonucleoside-triphosphate reductase activating protein [Sulfurimonas sp.]
MQFNNSDAKVIYDYTPFTHLDYPNHLACIVWFSGCNMRCDYCYNKDIVFAKDGIYSYDEVLKFLKTRQNLLEAVVLSGGEASSYDLVPFCQEIKKLGFKIKLDTNGTNYLHVKELLDLDLLDYIALDYKAPKDKFTQITHSNKYDEFSKTLDMLIQSPVNFEARTTIHSDLLNENDINIIIKDLVSRGYKEKYYLQEFLDTTTSIADLKAPTKTFNKALLSNDLQIVWR